MCVTSNVTSGIRDAYDNNGEIKLISHGCEGRSHDIIYIIYLSVYVIMFKNTGLSAKSDSGVMFYLQSCQGLIIDRSLVY